MESEELNQLIDKGETKEIEFKSWIKAKSKKDLMGVITKEAVALANTFGGYILVGVEDNGQITGCNDYDIQNIIESIYDRTVHKLFTDIEEVELGGKIVLAIKVQKSNQLISTSAGEVFKRLGKNSKPLYPDEYHLNEVTKTTKDFSTLVLADTSESNIN